MPPGGAAGSIWQPSTAEQGHLNAQYALGAAYNYDLGVAQDYAEAMRWYRKAAEQGHVSAHIGIGNLYSQGHGVAEGMVEAKRWWRKAKQLE